MGVGTQSDCSRSLFHGLERVFDLVQTALWRPSRDIVIVLVSELVVSRVGFHPRAKGVATPMVSKRVES